MGLIRIIQTGFFSVLWDFSVPAKSIAAWAALVVGVVVQILINKNARKPEGRLWFAALIVVLMIICEFTQYGSLLPDDPTVQFIYGLLICCFVGLAIPAICLWIKNKKRANKARGGDDNERQA